MPWSAKLTLDKLGSDPSTFWLRNECSQMGLFMAGKNKNSGIFSFEIEIIIKLTHFKNILTLKYT